MQPRPSRSLIQQIATPLILLFAALHLAASLYGALLAAALAMSRHSIGGSASLIERLVAGVVYAILFPLGDILLVLPSAAPLGLLLIVLNSLLWGIVLYRGTLLIEARWKKRFPERLQIAMTMRRALMTIFGCALAGGGGGAFIGFCIGQFLPAAYRSLFAPVEPGFSPTAVGIGLGIPQGLCFGAAIGVIVVMIITWYEIRMAELNFRTESR